MIVTGAQISAARAMLNWTRAELARAAGLHRNAVAYWERHEKIPTGRYRREPIACRHMREALRAAGVDVFTEPAPGVRFVPNGQ